EDSIYHELAVKPWMKKVEEKSDGRVKFDFYPAEQLGKTEDLLNLTQNKVADIGSIAINSYTDEMPYSSMVGGLPNLYENSYQGVKAYNELVESNSTVKEKDYTEN